VGSRHPHPDQLREVTARNAVECELLDEALGRVLAHIERLGWGDDVDVVFTTITASSAVTSASCSKGRTTSTP